MLEEILFGYQNLLHKINRTCESLEEHYAQHLVCKPGCSACCKVERSVLSLEAYVIEEQLNILSPQRIKKIKFLHRKDDHTCPMLWKNLCVIYPARPIICRTHGLPIFYHEAEITFIDYCRLNFTNLPENHKFSHKFVLDMRHFNSELIRLDQQYTKHVLNQDWQPDNRISLREVLFNLKMK
ncbi:hypothetical protein B6I21_01350 [candidate division KSB1 bacterium 4572_119]|nr:MAG: hypothetical protein B6I21_01350 [candidate division KSB1 bacterium 4572_119]